MGMAGGQEEEEEEAFRQCVIACGFKFARLCIAFVFSRHRSVNFGELGVQRCKECRTYLNPYVYWPPQDRGYKWQCNMCKLMNEVPQAYVAPVDSAGRRSDTMERPELFHSSIEIIAPAEYMKRPPQPVCSHTHTHTRARTRARAPVFPSVTGVCVEYVTMFMTTICRSLIVCSSHLPVCI
jgi:hypothetical protein